MEIHRDSNIFNENGIPSSGLLTIQDKPEVTGTAIRYPRTPLMDVKNKHSGAAPGMKPSRKFSIDSTCTRQNMLSQLVKEEPKRQERNTKSRKSCFAVFNLPEDFNALENRTGGVTIPRAIEEEPETFALQNQMLLDVSELSRTTRTRTENVKSKSVENLYKALASKDLDSGENKAAGITLPQSVDEEPETLPMQSQMMSDVYSLGRPARTSMGGLKSKSVESLYKALASKDLDSHKNKAAGTTLPQSVDEEPETLPMQSQMMSDVYSLARPARTSMGRLRSKSDESLHETLTFNDSDSSDNRAAGVTLSRATEDEPEMLTLQSQILSDVCMLNTETVTTVRNLKTQSNKSQYETLISSGSQSHFSLGELDFGGELTVLRDDTEIKDKYSVEPDCNTSSEQFSSYCDSNADDAAASVVGFSCEMKPAVYSTTPTLTTTSVCLPVMSLDEVETDLLNDILVKGCAEDFSENAAASCGSKEEVPTLFLDHQYSRAFVTNKDNTLLPEFAGQPLSAPALPNTSHSPHGIGSVQEQEQSSTPISAEKMSTFQGFVTPQLSSSFEFMNISNSSFQEELQKTDLEDLIQSYLFQNHIPSLDLSPVAEIHDMNQSNCRPPSPDESVSDVLKSPLVHPCRNQNIVTEVHLGNDKVCNLGADEECELNQSFRDSNVSFISNSSVLFVVNKVVEDDFMSACDVAPSNLTQNRIDKGFQEINKINLSDVVQEKDIIQGINRTDLSDKGQELYSSQEINRTNLSDETQALDIQDSNLNQEIDRADLSDELQDADQEIYKADFPAMLQDPEVNDEINSTDLHDKLYDANKRFTKTDCRETYQNNMSSNVCAIISGETTVKAHMGIAETYLLVKMGTRVSEVDDQMAHENFYRSVEDHTQVVGLLTGHSVCREVSVPLMLDDNQLCAGTNASDILQADVSIMTDKQNFVSTSMVTDSCAVSDVSVMANMCHGIDVSMVTDACQGVDVSMVTDACHGLDVSMMTDRVNMLEHSVMVVPECQTQETMTEKQTMVDATSFMTPLKLNKQGKRLTAEEVRRQHPRIVANQLDTLMASNQRLQKEVDNIVHSRDNLKSALVEARSKLAKSDKQLSEEKDHQGGVISIIEQYHKRTVDGLESSVKKKQDRIDNLESELTKLKLKYEETQGKWNSSSIELQKKCAHLEQFKSEAENHIAEETKKLQSHFEENNYYHAFLASQQVIREMQAEQEEFAKLVDDIEHSALLQSQLQDLLSPLVNKTQRVVKDHISVCERLTKEKQTLQKQLTSLQTDLEIVLSENKDLHEDIQNINDILKRSSENYTELESTYQVAKQDLCQSQVQVSELNSKIEFGFKIVKDLMKVKADLTDQLSEHQERNSLQSERVKFAEQEVENLTQQLERIKQLFSAKSDYYEQVIAEHDASKTSLELCIENLRNTLDSWEVDRDVQVKEISDCEEQMAKQRAKMEEMSKELQSLRKVKAVTQPERDYYQELRNTSKFLEAEKQLYLEALTDCRTRLEAEMELAASNTKLIDALRSNNTELQQSNDQLLSDVQMLEETLSLKSTDVDMSCSAMDNLQERMESVLSSLQQKLGLEAKPEISVRETLFTPNKREESSLVTRILSAAKSRQQLSQTSDASFAQQRISVNQDFSSCSFRVDETEKAKLRQSNVYFGTLQSRLGAEADSYYSPRSQSFSVTSQNARMLTDSKRSLMFSSTSKVKNSYSQNVHHPQTTARKDLSKLYPMMEQNMSTPGYAKICSIPSTVDRTLGSIARTKGENFRSMSIVNSPLDDTPPCLESDSMLAKVQLVDRVFNLILKTADMAQRASDLTVKDLKEDITLLEEKLKFHRCQSKDLETDLVQKSAQLTAAKSQIQELNARMREKTQSLMTLQDQQHQVTTLEEEKTELNRKVRALREEVKFQSEQLHEVLQKFADIKTGQKPECACVREIVTLKKKNHELVMKLFDEKDKNKEVGEKAMRRLKILEINWRKAEAEVKRFDELVEQIRETCIRSQAQSTNPVILQVVRLIDGVE